MFKIMLSLLLVLAASKTFAASVTDVGDHLIICRQIPIDMGIVYDSSVSIDHEEFEKGKEFLQNYLQQYEIGDGPDDTRVSVITFGQGVYPQDAFNLTTYHTKAEVIDAVGKIPHRYAQYTATGLGIQYMSQVQMTPQFTRPAADKIGIVITDGNSQEPELTAEKAKVARDAGIIMFAIGVDKVRHEELLNIAGAEERVIQVESYYDLAKIKQILARKTCYKQQKPTPPPQTACGVESPADIYFAFSPKELGMVGTAWTTSFINSIVSNEEMEEGFRFGVVSGNCPDDSGFDLDDYSSARAIRGRVNQFKKDRMSKIITKLASDSYSAASGGRPDARDIAVLVASGGKRAAKTLKKEVARLTAMGVEVYIADPTNSGISIGGATTLTGSGPRECSVDFVDHLCPTRTGAA